MSLIISFIIFAYYALSLFSEQLEIIDLIYNVPVCVLHNCPKYLYPNVMHVGDYFLSYVSIKIFSALKIIDTTHHFWHLNLSSSDKRAFLVLTKANDVDLFMIIVNIQSPAKNNEPGNEVFTQSSSEMMVDVWFTFPKSSIKTSLIYIWNLLGRYFSLTLQYIF